MTLNSESTENKGQIPMTLKPWQLRKSREAPKSATALRTLALALVGVLLAATSSMAVTGMATGSTWLGGGEALRAVQTTYELATSQLDAERWEEAIELFRAAFEEGDERADGALYWIAFAHSKKGSPTDAVASLRELEQRFPASRWLDDARYLRAEIEQTIGAAGGVAEEDDEDLRLYAINTLMHVDSDRALPLLERLLSEDNPVELKERALFVLMQSNSERAFDIAADIARNGDNRELQLRALRHLGMFRQDRGVEVMAEIYAASGDAEIKGAILQGFMMAGAPDRVLAVARDDTDVELRTAAIRAMAMMGDADNAMSDLWALYESESSIEVKEVILQSMFSRGATTRLLQIVRTESEPRLRLAALRGLTMATHGDDAATADVAEQLLELYGTETDTELRSQILHVFWSRGEASTLIQLFERESDPKMRKRIVQALAMSDSEEAIDFLIRMIEQ